MRYAKKRRPGTGHRGIVGSPKHDFAAGIVARLGIVKCSAGARADVQVGRGPLWMRGA